MQGGLHPDLKIDWHEKMLRRIKASLSKNPSALLFRVGNYRHRRVQRTIDYATLSCACATQVSIPSLVVAQKFSTTKSATRLRG